MAHRKQKDLFEKSREFGPNRTTKGDAHDVGKRKLSRPFRRHQPIHIVMKSEHAVGKYSLLSAKNQPAVETLLESTSAKFHVKVHCWQNVGNHCHLVISTSTRKYFVGFLRTFAAPVARKVSGSRRGRPQTKSFWTQTIFSRLIHGLRDLRGMFNYVAKNKIEALFGKKARAKVELAEELVRKKRSR